MSPFILLCRILLVSTWTVVKLTKCSRRRNSSAAQVGSLDPVQKLADVLWSEWFSLVKWSRNRMTDICNFISEDKNMLNGKDLEANGKMIREQEESQERSSVLAVFKKVTTSLFLHFDNICPESFILFFWRTRPLTILLSSHLSPAFYSHIINLHTMRQERVWCLSVSVAVEH